MATGRVKEIIGAEVARGVSLGGRLQQQFEPADASSGVRSGRRGG